MIYERGSLESRAMKMPSAWKSNKHPLWISEWGGGMYRKPFTGWSCIKQTSPPQIFMGRDLLINLSLSSISLFCIHQDLGAVIGYNNLHFTFSYNKQKCLQFCACCIAYMQQIVRQSNIWFSLFLSAGNQIWSFSDERGRQFSRISSSWAYGRGVWVTTHRWAHWGLSGSLHQHRCLSHRSDKLPLVNMAAGAPTIMNKQQRWKKWRTNCLNTEVLLMTKCCDWYRDIFRQSYCYH